MKVRTIRADWLERNGRRLDCNPYMTGAIEARAALQALRARKEPLHSLTRGHNGGIYNGPQFRRNFVQSPEYGVPFLTGGNVLDADLSTLPLLRKRDAESTKLAYLRLASGMTLISCSGTIGRMAFVRPNMDGVWSSQDVLKVVPDDSKIPPGYLYAYLSSKFGVPLIVGGTYGAIIQHIEPEHIANLPVPRVGKAIEQRVNDLVTKAAANRSAAAELRQQSLSLFCETLRLPDMTRAGTPLSFVTFSVGADKLGRLDAAFHSPMGGRAAAALERAKPTEALGTVAQVFQTNIFKRPYVDDSMYGYPYFSGVELFTYDPAPRGYLRKKALGIDEYLVKKDWLLMQDAGQLGGLIGRVVRVAKNQELSVVSNHLIRIVPRTKSDAAYLFTVFRSSLGYRAIVRHAFGSSIPQLESAHLAQVKIPWPDESVRQQIAKGVLRSWDLEDQAIILDREAILMVESEIQPEA